MIPISIKQVLRPPSAAEIYKQTTFGIAVGLTNTAKEAQKEVQSSIKSTFVTRGTWYEQSNRFGIKVKPATKTNLQAEVGTAADWLIPHETGQDKKPRGQNIAVPTDQVRRNKRLIIPRAQRPKGLAGKAFVLQTKHGPVLAQRLMKGKRKGLVVLYGLESRVKIRKQSTFYVPIEQVVKRSLHRNIGEGITRAFATMKR